MRRSKSSPMSSSRAASTSGVRISSSVSISRPSSSCLRSSRLLRRGDEGVLRELLGETDITQNPRETGDEPRRLDPPDCLDRTMGVGSRHGYRSHHLHAAGASRGYPYAQSLLCFGTEVVRHKHLANLGLALPARPVLLMKFHEA